MNRLKTDVKIGDKFYRWVVNGVPFDAGKSSYLVECICECGTVRNVLVKSLAYGKTQSCGCYRSSSVIDRTTRHNLTGSPEWVVWRSMKYRCTNPNVKGYENYGGRGITVCSRWLEPDGKGFLNFLEDMGERPEGMTLDRIDVDGDYELSNCRWADKYTQAYNTTKRESNKTGKTGVWFFKERNAFLAIITVKGKRIFLGQFKDLQEAIKAREDAELEYYGYIKE